MEKDEYGLQKIEGSVEQIVFCNEDNGYTVCDLSTEDDIVTVCGIMPMLCEGDRLCVYGKWVHSAKYGRQFSVEQYERVMPADTASMLRYLSSRAIKGIGPIVVDVDALLHQLRDAVDGVGTVEHFTGALVQPALLNPLLI